MLLIIFKLKRWNDPRDNSYHGKNFNNQNKRALENIYLCVEMSKFTITPKRGLRNQLFLTVFASRTIKINSAIDKTEDLNHSGPGEVTEGEFV